MGQLKLKDLYIGKTDGYNEFLDYGSDVCRNLFFEYPNLDIQCLYRLHKLAHADSSR